MNTQNQIKRTLSTSTGIEYIKQLLRGNEVTHRSDVAKYVCTHFKFHDVRGELQTSGCLKALRERESSGHFDLPKARHKAGTKSPRRLTKPVPLPVDVPREVTAINALELVWVREAEQMRIWNELMITEHYLGTATLVGRQMRYLIRSGQGWLGGLGFAAPALQLSARDQWIGWGKEERQAQLHTIVGMSRFLIRPSVHCKNLASKVLGMSMATIADDFDQQYGYRPLLIESFVDTEHYSGTCYQAANWLAIGETKGRGRQDRYCESRLSRKTISMYALDTQFRKQLGLSPSAGLGALGISEGLDAAQWAEHEFGGAPLGDKRLSKRLVSVAHAKAQTPSRTFSGVAQGDWAATKAYYRMIDQPDDSAVNLTNILHPHRERTARRMRGQKTVLCVQDSSELNYTNLEKCRGLGDLKANQTGAKTKGLNLHSTVAIAPNGLPLGVLKAQCIAPQIRSPDDKRKPSKIPIEEKKMVVWIEHHRDLVDLAATMPARWAELALRHLTIQLPAPSYYRDKEPIDIQLIHALEENPPQGTKAVEWFLLTTIKIDSATDIEKCLRWYTLRWRIEDWHRVLKSGCNIDDLAHETAERLRRAIGINLVIAWRIMLMTLLGREVPELSAEILFSDVELRTLHAYAKKRIKTTRIAGRSSTVGSKDWRTSRSQKRSASGTSSNVARICSFTAFVYGFLAAGR